MKSGKSFVLIFCLGVDCAQHLARYNRWLRVFMLLTDRNTPIS